MVKVVKASKHTIAIPAGESIREQLSYRNMSQKEFAIRMGLSEKHVSHLLNGRVELTQSVALKLEAVLGVPASFWNNLEAIYREKLERVTYELGLEEDSELAASFPYAKMANLGWIVPTRKKTEKALNLRKFFEVASLKALSELCVPGIAYRTMTDTSTKDYHLAAWAQKAKLEARQHKVEKINIEKLKQNLPTIREMTLKEPKEFCDELIKIYAGCGVALVFLPHIGGSFLHGATFTYGDHIVMGLTVRGKDADKFWFSMFHELCHIFENHINPACDYKEEWEQKADEFARDTLIPPAEFQNFLQEACFSKGCIIEFSKQIGIAPGIVVGRLQKEEYITFDRFNDLKDKYEIAGKNEH